jgi:gas vesicle protein
MHLTLVGRAYCNDSWWDKAQDLWDEARQWSKEKYNDAKDWWADTSDKAKDWYGEKSKETEKWWDETKDWGQNKVQEYWQKTQEFSEQTIQEIEQFARQFEETAKQNFETAVEIANEVVGPYKEEAYIVLEREARRQLCEEYSDPEKVGELEKKRNLPTEITITIIKLMPIYDPEKKEVHTFDEFARNLYSDIPGIEGSDLAEDPVRCVILMVLDRDYLMYAKIVKAPNGKWMSMTEALSVGYRTDEVLSAVADYNLAREGYKTNDPIRIENGIESLVSRINAINENANATVGLDPLMLMPFGLIGTAAAIFLKLDNKKKKTKH